MSLRVGIVLISVVLLSPLARAREEPPGCFDFGVAIDIFAFRSDGTTPLSGTVTDCEQIVYRPTIGQSEQSNSLCAFSGGTFTLATPDGVVHTVSANLPCIGGETGLEGCDDSIDSFVGAPIVYTVSPADVHDGKITAHALYSGGVLHDNDIANTPGIIAVALRTTLVTPCQATTTVATSSSTTSTTAMARSTCASLKVEAAAKLGSALAECNARALRLGVSVREECFDGAIAAFEKSWATAEKRADCLTTGDQASIASLVVSHTLGLESVLVP